MFKITVENLEALLPTQREVNRKVNEKLEKKPNSMEYILAFNIEFYEFLNEVGTWKWWKHNHVVNKERILDELADCYAFFLSVMLTVVEEVKQDDVIQYPRKNLLNNVVNLYNNMLEQIRTSEDATVNDLILLMGTSSELTGENHIGFFTEFCAANSIAGMLWSDLTWDEVANAFLKKSSVNVDRQNQNY